jgi:lysophospholipase L1-like esterase
MKRSIHRNAVVAARRIAALVCLASVCACSGAANTAAGSGTLPAAPNVAHRRAAATGILSRIVGVGDSLTAGYQAGGFLGETGYRDPLDPSKFVQPGQESGWWADLVEKASGLPSSTAIAQMYDPATSPLPLIKAPGLNNQVVPAVGLSPIGTEKSGNTCADDHGFNAAGYLLGGLPTVRMNPTSSLIRNVAVPGITLHEANTLTMPQTDTCEPLPGIPGLLSQIIGGESSTYWPVLGTFARMGQNLTMVNAAASLHPTLATVWLGANDVLKYMGTGGRFVGGDNSAAQTYADLHQTIQTLRASGAKVVVANLPDVVLTPYFMRVSLPASAAACKVQTYVYCLLVGLGFPSITAKPLTLEIAAAYHLATPAGCAPASTTSACGYITLPGALDSLAYYLVPKNNFKLPDLDCSGANFTPPCVPGSGLGAYYITPAFAAKIQLLNDAINQGIAQAATSTFSGFVDIRAIFDGVASGNPANAYFRQAASVSPGVCCTLAYGAGLVSFDGLHPSNTGYALLAYHFIQTINQRWGTHIPEIDIRRVYDGTRCSNKRYCFPDEYAPPFNGFHVNQLLRLTPSQIRRVERHFQPAT